jgi:Homing endonuclease associated repeat
VAVAVPGAAAAFERRFREEVAAGRSPDALRRYTEDEVERFWSRTIAGLDGHVYWDGPRDGFICNDGRKRMAARWVWQRRHGGAQLTRDVSVVAVCGERNCIAPGHLALVVRARRYTDEQAIGAAQVWAMRNGRPPSTRDWDAERLKPCRNTITARFGSWPRFLAAAGLTKGDACAPTS